MPTRDPLSDLDAVLVMMAGGLCLGLGIALVFMTAHPRPALWAFLPVALGIGLLRWGAGSARH